MNSCGFDKIQARNLLMYAFTDEVSSHVEKKIQGEVGVANNLKNRIIRRLENVVPKGDRAIQGDFQSV